MSAASFQQVERSFLFSPIGLLIRDGFTGDVPLGSVNLKLEQLVNGDWIQVDKTPSVSSGNVWSFPGLGRSVSFDNSPANFRVRIEAPFYSTHSPIPFEVHAYDDDRPLNPTQFEQIPRLIILQTNSRYPFPTNNPIVRGRIVDSKNRPIANVKIGHKVNQNVTVSTDADGFFSIPILWLPEGTWPPSEVLLGKDVNAGERVITLSSLAGIRSGDQIGFEEDSCVVLEKNTGINKQEIVVNDVKNISGSMKLLLQDSSLSPRNRRFAIDWIDPDQRIVRLKGTTLSQQVPEGTKILTRSRKYQIGSVNEISSTVTLTRQLDEPWGRTTRLVRFLPDLVIDVSHDSNSIQLKVPIPDGFRFFEIEL